MAAEKAMKNLQEETTCSICLDFFHDPVMLLDCGHNFCRHCLDDCPTDATGAGSCPLCRLPFPRGGFRPNRQLANMAVAVQKLMEEFCQRHRRPLTLFCYRDGILLCTACAEHRTHPAVPLEEAARWYWEQFEAFLKALEEGYERCTRLVMAMEQTRQEILTRPVAEEQKLLAVLGGSRQMPSREEVQFLLRLSRLRRQLERQRLREAAELDWLRQRRTELRAKYRQSDGDLLQDAQITPNRCTEPRVQRLLLLPPPLVQLPPQMQMQMQLLLPKWEDFPLKIKGLAEPEKPCEDVLGCSLEEDAGGYQRATVTLDPATAHPQILVSADGRTAERQEFPLPSGSERFESLH